MGEVRLSDYSWVVVNSSAGKDSQCMLTVLVEKADSEGYPRSKLVVAHADLGRVEWPGTRELAGRQARHYGLRFEAIKRPQGDLLDHVRKRGKWPSSKQRYCTSDHKRGQVAKLFTQLTKESGGRASVLNCLGMRAQESPARSKLAPFENDRRQTNNRRHVDRWLPIHGWTHDEVWAKIRASGVPHHPAYDLGMPRLSCCFCIFSPRAALLLAGKHNPELLAEYAELEKEIGHTFRKELPIAEVKAALDAGEEPGRVVDWRM